MIDQSDRRSRGEYPSVNAMRCHLPLRGRICGDAIGPAKSSPGGGGGPPKAVEGYILQASTRHGEY